MDMVLQTPAPVPLATTKACHEAIAPQQVWTLLTQGQQQIAMQTLIQVSFELVRQLTPEVHDEQPSA